MKRNEPYKFNDFTRHLTATVLSGKDISFEDAEKIVSLQEQTDIIMLMAHSNIIRQHFNDSGINLCAIINARSGRCSEDCRFCVQSSHYKTDVETYPLIKNNDILEAAKVATASGVDRFSIVTSGRTITSDKHLERICSAVKQVSETVNILPCASLGILNESQLGKLKLSGLKRYHHNLECAESFFPNVCTTHSFSDRVKTIQLAQKQDFEICSGGILGLGETPRQRIELAFTLKQLGVDSVALNFLHPMPGTPFENQPMLSPFEILKTIAMFRFVMPNREIRICGGRQVCLKTLQPFIYTAGANGIMVGNYLTTEGRNIHTDIEEIQSMQLHINFAGQG